MYVSLFRLHIMKIYTHKTGKEKVRVVVIKVYIQYRVSDTIYVNVMISYTNLHRAS